MHNLVLILVAAFSHPDTLITVATFGRHQPVGLAVSRENRIFVTFPAQSGGSIHDLSLAEIKNGQRIPYPDKVWNDDKTTDPDHHFKNLQALWTTGKTLWALDAGHPMKLVKINLTNAHVERIYRFADLDKIGSSLNDVRIDEFRQLAYFSDPGQAALVILDLKTGKSRSLLKKTKFTLVAPGYVLHLDGQDVINTSGVPISSNVNGIALTSDYRFFYFRAINQEHVYRIGTQYLADASLTDAELETHVEDMERVGVSHGMISDQHGNVYFTDSPDYAITYLTPGGEVKTLVKDKRLSWPDSFGIGTDGYLYVTAAQLNRTTRYNMADRTIYPYGLYKVKLP
ncbi:Major royal jelly protein [bacterium A37T11]|nr:Major royal jelly protein [bacterium A37T11]